MSSALGSSAGFSAWILAPHRYIAIFGGGTSWSSPISVRSRKYPSLGSRKIRTYESIQNCYDTCFLCLKLNRNSIRISIYIISYIYIYLICNYISSNILRIRVWSRRRMSQAWQDLDLLSPAPAAPAAAAPLSLGAGAIPFTASASLPGSPSVDATK